MFDKGNVSDDAMEEIVASGQHFVAAMGANRVSRLLAIPPDQFKKIVGMPGTKTFVKDEVFWGKKCLSVVTYTESFFTQQLSSVTQDMVKCQRKLLDLEKSLIKWRKGKARGRRPTVKTVKARVNKILSGQFMKKIFDIKVELEKKLPVLHYAINHTVLDNLTHKRLGRTALVTDRTNWKAEQVIKTYRSLNRIENAFKNMKNTHFLHWQPAYHWTDQKLKVHGFYCVLALLLSSLARKVATQAMIVCKRSPLVY